MFKKETFTLEQLLQLDFNIVLWLAVPILISPLILEWIYSYRKKIESYESIFFASLSVGFVKLVLNGLQKVGLYTIILFFYNLLPLGIPHTW
tara:strand:- start:16989 stop:17264 length:276 start_codon:yes stop_codon:yes gene_type:complete